MYCGGPLGFLFYNCSQEGDVVCQQIKTLFSFLDVGAFKIPSHMEYIKKKHVLH